MRRRAKLLVVWWCMLAVAAVMLLPAAAFAQAPDPSVLASKTNAELHDLAANPRNDILLRRSAATALVTRLSDAGAFDAADAAAHEFARNLDPAAVKHVQLLRRRARIHVGALVVLGAVVVVLVLCLLSARRDLRFALPPVRRLAPPIAFFLFYVAVAGGYLATTYESGNASPFLLLAAAMLPLLLIFRLWSAVGSAHPAARAGRAVAAVAGIFVVSFLCVELVNPTYLEGFGL